MEINQNPPAARPGFRVRGSEADPEPPAPRPLFLPRPALPRAALSPRGGAPAARASSRILAALRGGRPRRVLPGLPRPPPASPGLGLGREGISAVENRAACRLPGEGPEGTGRVARAGGEGRESCPRAEVSTQRRPRRPRAASAAPAPLETGLGRKVFVHPLPLMEAGFGGLASAPWDYLCLGRRGSGEGPQPWVSRPERAPWGGCWEPAA